MDDDVQAQFHFLQSEVDMLKERQEKVEQSLTRQTELQEQMAETQRMLLAGQKQSNEILEKFLAIWMPVEGLGRFLTALGGIVHWLVKTRQGWGLILVMLIVVGAVHGPEKVKGILEWLKQR